MPRAFLRNRFWVINPTKRILLGEPCENRLGEGDSVEAFDGGTIRQSANSIDKEPNQAVALQSLGLRIPLNKAAERFFGGLHSMIDGLRGKFPAVLALSIVADFCVFFSLEPRQ